MIISETTTDHFQPRSAVMKTLVERGYVNQATDLAGIDAAFEAGVVPAYVGFDATADSLHVGHLLPDHDAPLASAGWPQAHRAHRRRDHPHWRPSFRSEVRPMLTDEQIAQNIDGIRKVFIAFSSSVMDPRTP